MKLFVKCHLRDKECVCARVHECAYACLFAHVLRVHTRMWGCVGEGRLKANGR